MSMNGITGYSTYTYTNPYAVPNYNGTQTTFQETTQTYTNQAKEENNTGLLIAGIGAAALAVGTGIYALKKGKAINGADGKFLDNLKTGFQKIGETIGEKVKSIFSKNKREVVGEEKLKSIKGKWDTARMEEQIQEFGPVGTRAQERYNGGYESMINNLFANAELDKNGLIANALERDKVIAEVI